MTLWANVADKSSDIRMWRHLYKSTLVERKSQWLALMPAHRANASRSTLVGSPPGGDPEVRLYRSSGLHVWLLWGPCSGGRVIAGVLWKSWHPTWDRHPLLFMSHIGASLWRTVLARISMSSMYAAINSVDTWCNLFDKGLALTSLHRTSIASLLRHWNTIQPRIPTSECFLRKFLSRSASTENYHGQMGFALGSVIITPRPTKLVGGVYWFHLVRLSVRPSVHPSVDGFVSALYLLQYWSDLFHFWYGDSPWGEGVSHVTVTFGYRTSLIMRIMTSLMVLTFFRISEVNFNGRAFKIWYKCSIQYNLSHKFRVLFNSWICNYGDFVCWRNRVKFLSSSIHGESFSFFWYGNSPSGRRCVAYNICSPLPH